MTHLHEVRLFLREMNPIAADLTVEATGSLSAKEPTAATLWAEAFEVGTDGSQPDFPLAVSERGVWNFSTGETPVARLALRIGTPFLSNPENHPRYSVRVSVERTGTRQYGEIQFRFDAAGKIVVTEALKPSSPPPPAAKANLPSVLVVGDSTAFSNGRNQRGWGDAFRGFFDTTTVNILNHARPGRSTRSFRNEGLWDRARAQLKVGDWVLLQFGHNDADTLNEGRCRGVLPGLGDETQRVTLPGGCVETVHTFGWYLRQFIAEAKAMGATPVLLSPTPRNLWREGRLVRQQNDYGRWSRATAERFGAVFIDVAEIIADRYDALGEEKVQALFCDAADDVHTSRAGAQLSAECVARGLQQFAGRPMQRFLKPLPARSPA